MNKIQFMKKIINTLKHQTFINWSLGYVILLIGIFFNTFQMTSGVIGRRGENQYSQDETRKIPIAVLLKELENLRKKQI
jgi:hypothetical protein